MEIVELGWLGYAKGVQGTGNPCAPGTAQSSFTMSRVEDRWRISKIECFTTVGGMDEISQILDDVFRDWAEKEGVTEAAVDRIRIFSPDEFHELKRLIMERTTSKAKETKDGVDSQWNRPTVYAFVNRQCYSEVTVSRYSHFDLAGSCSRRITDEKQLRAYLVGDTQEFILEDERVEYLKVHLPAFVEHAGDKPVLCQTGYDRKEVPIAEATLAAMEWATNTSDTGLWLRGTDANNQRVWLIVKPLIEPSGPQSCIM